jgi:hypothetical protein
MHQRNMRILEAKLRNFLDGGLTISPVGVFVARQGGES